MTSIQGSKGSNDPNDGSNLIKNNGNKAKIVSNPERNNNRESQSPTINKNILKLHPTGKEKNGTDSSKDLMREDSKGTLIIENRKGILLNSSPKRKHHHSHKGKGNNREGSSQNRKEGIYSNSGSNHGSISNLQINSKVDSPRGSKGGGDSMCSPTYGHRRIDAYGVKITRGRKRHCISFRDQIEGKPLSEVKLVESYKKYNADTSSSGNCGCSSCIII